MKPALPVVDGVGASRVRPPPGPWPTVLAFLVERFPAIGRDVWEARIDRGRVLDAGGEPIRRETPFTADAAIHYYRELDDEPVIPFEAEIVHRDEHLLIADKPHFLPVIPSGRWLRQTLLVRLKQTTGLDDLVPLHRIDRGTAGLVAFSIDPRSRGAYQSLFPRRAVRKVYEALAPALPDRAFPRIHRSRLVASEPFFRMREVPGEPNSETRIAVIGPRDAGWHYRLEPLTGRKHQLRVHLAGLGAPIFNDDFYPAVRVGAADGVDDDFDRPLKLLARELAFVDPLTGVERVFRSRRAL